MGTGISTGLGRVQVKTHGGLHILTSKALFSKLLVIFFFCKSGYYAWLGASLEGVKQKVFNQDCWAQGH